MKVHVLAGGVALAVVIGSLAIAERAASANAAARAFSTPEATSGALSARPTRIEVEREDLRILCHDVAANPQCRFEATYHLHNRASEDEEAAGVFYGSQEAELAIRLDGTDARAALDPQQVASLDAAVRMATGGLPSVERMPARTGFHIRLAGGARETLVFAGPLHPTFSDNPSAYGGLAIPAYQARHVALASHERRDARYDYRYLLAPLWTWGGARAIAVEIDVPERWRFSPPEQVGRWTTTAAGGRTVARSAVSGDPSGPPVLPLSVVVPGRTLLAGGPFIGAGGAFGDARGLRLRAGYELAGPSWLLYSLALETNARDRASGTLLVEAASANLAFVIPAAALGLGPVVEHGPGQTATGARVQTALSWLFVTAVLHVDLFPGQAAPARWALLGQLSF